MAKKNVQIDAEEIGARFLMINKRFDSYSAGPSSTKLQALLRVIKSPTGPDVTQAKKDLHNASTAAQNCPRCQIGTEIYYGLTNAQCMLMGGRCIGRP
jgi:hypothetical protein